MKKFFRIASVFLILASFIGCPSPEIGKNPGEEQNTGSIVGKVVYENENVIISEKDAMRLDDSFAQYKNLFVAKQQTKIQKEVLEKFLSHLEE